MADITLIIFLLAITVLDAQESQLEGPQNTLSYVSSDVTLKCSSPSRDCTGIDWQRYFPGLNTVTVFKGPGMIMSAVDRDRYSVDNSSGCDLVIRNVQLTDAGRFICSAIMSSNQSTKSANLIVLETQPICSVNGLLDEIVGEEVPLTCHVTYNATNRPSMIWKGVGNASDAVDSGKSIRRSYSVVASAPEVPSFTCVTLFAIETDGNKRQIGGLASNSIPNATCATPAIKVLYSVRNVNLSPSSAIYSPDDIITCTAEGYPAPSIKWQTMEPKVNATWEDIAKEKHHPVSQCTVGLNWYRCVATNVVRGKLHAANSSTFQILKSDEINSTLTKKFYGYCLGVDIEGFCGLGTVVGIGIGIGIGFFAAIILASITFAILVRCRKFHPRPKDDIVQHMMEPEICPSVSHQPSAVTLPTIPRAEPSLAGEKKSAYATLRAERVAPEYTSLELGQTAKPRR